MNLNPDKYKSNVNLIKDRSCSSYVWISDKKSQKKSNLVYLTSYKKDMTKIISK